MVEYIRKKFLSESDYALTGRDPRVNKGTVMYRQKKQPRTGERKWLRETKCVKRGERRMRKLYYESAYIREFEGIVLSCREGKKGWEIVLDQTAFYPEGGGQPADHGSLGSVHVLDVHEKDGLVVHTTDGPLEEGQLVKGMLDWERRFLHMQEHSGEHLVSGLIHSRYGYDNVGFHMGTEEVTIDFNGLLEWDQLMEIENQANRLLWENGPVEAGFPSKEELERLDYRSKKELSGDIRIVQIPGADICACCGTHVERTGEIGLVKFLSMIHYKGGVRISLLCGRAAVMDYEKRREQLQNISVLLSAKPLEAAKAVEKKLAEADRLKEALAKSSRRLVELEISGMEKKKGRRYILEPDFDGLLLRHLVNRMLEEERGETVLALGMAAGGGFLYVMGSRTEDMRLLSKELNALLSGRGGGSPQMVQGTFFAEQDMLNQILHERGFIQQP